MSERIDLVDSPEARRQIRRIEVLAAVYGAVGGAGYLLLGNWAGAGILTLSALLSIVGFRGLQVQVRHLEPQAGGRLGPFNTLLILVRFSLLIIALLAGLTWMSSRHGLALLLGLTALPFALMSESLIQWGRSLRRATNGS